MFYLETIMNVLKICVAVGTRSRGRSSTRTISVPHVRPDLDPDALAACVEALGELIDAPIVRYRVARRVRRRDVSWMLAQRAEMLARRAAMGRMVRCAQAARDFRAACTVHAASCLYLRHVVHIRALMYHIDSS